MGDFSCPKCPSATFKNARGLDTHTSMKHYGKSYDCEECPRTYKQQAQLENHVNVEHRGLLKYACSLCDKKFGYPVRLSYHMGHDHRNVDKSERNESGSIASKKPAKAVTSTGKGERGGLPIDEPAHIAVPAKRRRKNANAQAGGSITPPEVTTPRQEEGAAEDDDDDFEVVFVKTKDDNGNRNDLAQMSTGANQPISTHSNSASSNAINSNERSGISMPSSHGSAQSLSNSNKSARTPANSYRSGGTFSMTSYLAKNKNAAMGSSVAAKQQRTYNNNNNNNNNNVLAPSQARVGIKQEGASESMSSQAVAAGIKQELASNGQPSKSVDGDKKAGVNILFMSAADLNEVMEAKKYDNELLEEKEKDLKKSLKRISLEKEQIEINLQRVDLWRQTPPANGQPTEDFDAMERPLKARMDQLRMGEADVNVMLAHVALDKRQVEVDLKKIAMALKEREDDERRDRARAAHAVA